MMAKANYFNKGLKYSWRRNNDFDPFLRLAAAVINSAAKDYAKIAAGLESPFIDQEKVESKEVEANVIEEWLMNPLNPFVNYLGVNPDAIERFILRASSGEYVSDRYDAEDD